MAGYRVMILFRDHDRTRTLATGLTEQEAQEMCRQPEGSSKTAVSPTAKARTAKWGPWFYAYDEDKLRG